MDFDKAIENKIIGNGDDLIRRKKLWKKINYVYEQGGEVAIESALIESSKSIIEDFNESLEKLKKKL